MATADAHVRAAGHSEDARSLAVSVYSDDGYALDNDFAYVLDTIPISERTDSELPDVDEHAADTSEPGPGITWSPAVERSWRAMTAAERAMNPAQLGQFRRAHPKALPPGIPAALATVRAPVPAVRAPVPAVRAPVPALRAPVPATVRAPVAAVRAPVPAVLATPVNFGPSGTSAPRPDTAAPARHAPRWHSVPYPRDRG
jgi:hypothetical protein